MSIKAGTAAPSPPVGPRLGQLGVNIMQFCKEFNAATDHIMTGVPVTTKITAYEDRTAVFEFYSPPVSWERGWGNGRGTTRSGWGGIVF
mmetsp:Transcript_23016/g.57169  ORF Transcript_23016/g.57169 Transcript_23016/m.57169 type:complete len:89 (+) Transcript_23016:2-268(+)